MNRRTALMLSMFLGGLTPRGLWAQTAGRKPAKTRDKALQPASRTEDPEDPATTGDEPAAPFAPSPAFNGGDIILRAIPKSRAASPTRRKPSLIGSSSALA